MNVFIIFSVLNLIIGGRGYLKLLATPLLTGSGEGVVVVVRGQTSVLCSLTLFSIHPPCLCLHFPHTYGWTLPPIPHPCIITYLLLQFCPSSGKLVVVVAQALLTQGEMVWAGETGARADSKGGRGQLGGGSGWSLCFFSYAFPKLNTISRTLPWLWTPLWTKQTSWPRNSSSLALSSAPSWVLACPGLVPESKMRLFCSPQLLPCPPHPPPPPLHMHLIAGGNGSLSWIWVKMLGILRAHPPDQASPRAHHQTPGTPNLRIQ